MGAIELVVTDLDGTLWGADERIHDRTLEALRALERRGLPLLVATGRRFRSAEAVLARSRLAPPMVVLDGAMGRVPATGRSFHDAVFPPGAAARVLEVFRRHGLEPCVYVDLEDVEVFVGEHPSTSPRHLAIIGRWARRGDLDQVVARERVYAFGVVAGDAAVLAGVLRDAAADVHGAVTRDVLHGGATLMVHPTGVSKWAGVLAWCRDQGLDPDRVLAVGDGENDVELLSAAAVACVVRDGCDAALALADHVLEPAATGGWSAVLDLAS
jgi:hydroxymethylpyrimidine pyrophosphatase-like HAD family hydrolase